MLLMSTKDYFKDWWRFFDKKEFNVVIEKLKKLYTTKNICPTFSNVFKAFNLCKYQDAHTIIIGQEPYSTKGVATGLAFANMQEPLSPSLEVIKNAVIDFELPHNFINFAPDLEEWAKEGVLLLNSALTVEANKPYSHLLMWKRFISSFLFNVTSCNNFIVVLLGNEAISFKPYIGQCCKIFEEKHPSWYARNKKEMPSKFFRDVEDEINKRFGINFKFYEEVQN